jgi:hypothetical protein
VEASGLTNFSPHVLRAFAELGARAEGHAKKINRAYLMRAGAVFECVFFETYFLRIASRLYGPPPAVDR